MKILNRSKSKSNSFKGTFLKIGVIVLIAFMCFGAMKSCVKVNAEVSSIDTGGLYCWSSIDLVNGQYTSDFIGNIFAEFQWPPSSDYTVYFRSNVPLVLYNNVSYDSIRLSQTITNSTYVVETISYVIGDPVETSLEIYHTEFDTDNGLVYYDQFTNGVSPYFSLLTDTFGVQVYGLTGSFTLSDTLFKYISNVSSSSSADIYMRGFEYGHNYALYNFDTSTYFQDGFDKGRQYELDRIRGDIMQLTPVQDAIHDAYEQGKLDGYEEGFDDSNPYTFKRLIFSAVSAPVTVLSESLNFNFLGYNMRDFCFSCFTLALLFAILRRLL